MKGDKFATLLNLSFQTALCGSWGWSTSTTKQKSFAPSHGQALILCQRTLAGNPSSMLTFLLFTSNLNITLPPSATPLAFELLMTGLFKFLPPRAKIVFKCPTQFFFSQKAKSATMAFYTLTKLYKLDREDLI